MKKLWRRLKAWLRSKQPPKPRRGNAVKAYPIILIHIIGHNKYDGGAYSDILKSSEYAYYTQAFELLNFNQDDKIFVLDRNDGWGGVQSRLYELAIEYPEHHFVLCEWHFNAGGGHGYEVLTVDGRPSWLSDLFLDTMGDLHPQRDNRGVKFPKRGRYNLEVTSEFGEAIIAEPFFGDTNDAMETQDIMEVIQEITNRIMEQ